MSAYEVMTKRKFGMKRAIFETLFGLPSAGESIRFVAHGDISIVLVTDDPRLCIHC